MTIRYAAMALRWISDLTNGQRIARKHRMRLVHLCNCTAGFAKTCSSVLIRLKPICRPSTKGAKTFHYSHSIFSIAIEHDIASR